MLGNYTKIQTSIIRLVLVAVVDDLPFLEAAPSASSGADVFLGVAVREVGVVGAEIPDTAVRTNLKPNSAANTGLELDRFCSCTIRVRSRIKYIKAASSSVDGARRVS